MNAWHVRRGVSWLSRPAALPSKLRRWLRRRALTPAYRAALSGRELQVEAGPLPDRFTISVAMPVFRVAERHLRAAIASVAAQSWPDWELLAVDDASPDPHVARVLAEAAADPRVRVVRRSANGGVSVTSDEAVATARGEYVAFLDHDDVLHPRALELAVRFLVRRPETDWLFTDEDRVDEAGAHSEPMFKPGWSRHLLLALNLVSHMRVVRRAAIESAGGHRPGFEGAQDYDLALRLLASGGTFRHLPGPLYHWREAPGSMARVASEKPAANVRALAALLEHAGTFPRGGEPLAEVLVGSASLFRVRRPADPDISLAVAVRDAAAFDPAGWGPWRARPVAIADLGPAALAAAATSCGEDVLVVPPPTGMGADAVAELLALLQVPRTGAAAGRLVTGARVAASGWVASENGQAIDPWAGMSVHDPGYLNLALLPSRRLAPPPAGWVAWRVPLLAAWDAAAEVEETWRLAAGWMRLGLEVVTTPDVDLPCASLPAAFRPGPAPEELPHARVAALARLGLNP